MKLDLYVYTRRQKQSVSHYQCFLFVTWEKPEIEELQQGELIRWPWHGQDSACNLQGEINLPKRDCKDYTAHRYFHTNCKTMSSWYIEVFHFRGKNCYLIYWFTKHASIMEIIIVCTYMFLSVSCTTKYQYKYQYVLNYDWSPVPPHTSQVPVVLSCNGSSCFQGY